MVTGAKYGYVPSGKSAGNTYFLLGMGKSAVSS